MDLSRCLLAGMASGSFMGVLFLGVGATVLIAQPRVAAQLADLPDRRIGPFRASVALPVAILVGWMAIGLLFGVANFVVAETLPSKAIGSPNAIYTLAIVILSVAAILLALQRWRRFARQAIGIGAGFAIVFGWLLPWLAA